MEANFYIMLYEKKRLNRDGQQSTNTNKTNNHLSPQTIKHEEDHFHELFLN